MLSIIIPTCHRANTLASCLQCLAPGAQTAPADQYETIVTDDSSNLTSREMMEHRFPWTRWVQGPCRGPAANRNHGARQAVFEWIAFCDDDCLPEPGWVEALMKALRLGDVDVVEGRTTCKAGLPGPEWHAPINLSGGFLWSCNFAVRRELFNKMGGFDERFPFAHMEDCDLHERLRSADATIRFCPEAVVDHPPRRLPGPLRLARMHESEVLFNRIHSGRMGMGDLLQNVLRARVRALMRSPAMGKMLVSLAQIPIEVAAMILLSPFWAWKYRAPLPLWREGINTSEHGLKG